MDSTTSFYSQPSYYHMRGAGGMPVFSGSRRMRGGGILGALKSLVLPTLKTIGKKVGKKVLSEGVNFATALATDKLLGRDMEKSAKARGRMAAAKVLTTARDEGLRALTSNTSVRRTAPAVSRKRTRLATSRTPTNKRRRATKKNLF